MFSRLFGKKIENRSLRRNIELGSSASNPLISQVRKVLSSADQQLILMARS